MEFPLNEARGVDEVGVPGIAILSVFTVRSAQCTVQSVQCTSEVGGSASLKVHFDRTLGGLLPPWRGLCVMIDIFIGVLMKNCQKKK